MNALHCAAMGGHIETIYYLALKMRSLLQSTDNNGRTMLHFAVLKGHADVVQLLNKEFHLDPTASDKVRVICPISVLKLYGALM